ncbi:hypothetical protein COO60DRAFT_1636055 [Scenedesmus sp. NREL 46B-D3]|nr:hypothetical protein COO60DRAFT_1636055 [Scenedesmus sp. NREL 46B-D3]
MQLPNVRHGLASSKKRSTLNPFAELLTVGFASGASVTFFCAALYGAALQMPERVALLCCIGALNQKPRPQLLGAFLADMQPRLARLSRAQLCGCLEALSRLRLTKLDTQRPRGSPLACTRLGVVVASGGLVFVTGAGWAVCGAGQGVRATTAQSAPTPSEFTSQLLRCLDPQLAGAEGADARQLAAVLTALAGLGVSPEEAWLARALDGAAGTGRAACKLRAAVAAPGGEHVLVSFLHALSQLAAPAPPDVLAEVLAQLQAGVERLSAVQISGAMAALKRLGMDPDDQLMGSYLERAAAAAAAGTATAADMAAVLQSLAAAGVVPSAAWMRGFLAAVQQQLAGADSQTLAAICRAAAALTEAGQASSSSSSRSSSSSDSSYSPDPRFVSELAAVATSRLGSSYMDASRILNTPDYKAPLNLSGLADAAWGLVHLGAKPKGLQPLINMLISKSYDRFSQLSPQQLCGVAWAIARCSGSGGASAAKLPSKWLNQFAAAVGPGVQQLTKPQLTELIWALGRLYLSANGQYTTGSGSSSSGSSSSSTEGSSSSSSSSSTSSSTTTNSVMAGSSIGRSSDVPVQQLLRAVASQLDSQLLEQQQGPGQTEVSTMVNLLTKFDCSASRQLLQRFCADVAGAWPQLSDAAVADAAVAVAVLVGAGSSSSSSSSIVPPGWMQDLADQVQNSRPQPRASLAGEFAGAAFTREAAALLQPGDLSDALWALYSLEQLDSNSKQQQQQQGIPPTSDTKLAATDAGSTSREQPADASSSLLTVQLMQLLGGKLDRRVPELQAPQVLRLLLLAEGALAVAPSYSLPKGVADQLSQVLSARGAVVAESTGVVRLVWAAARLRLRLHIMTLDQFCKRMYAQLPGMWLPPQLEEFDRQSSLKLGGMSGADVALLLEAYKAFGHAPSADWLQRFAEMPAASLTQLSCDEALQLAVQLADGHVGLPASRITWLADWAGSLTAQQLQDMTGQQVFSVLRLLGDASAGSTEPLLSKLELKVREAAAVKGSSRDTAATAELLSGVLLALPNPKPSLVSGLMQQLMARYITDSGFRPTAQVMAGIEQLLLLVLREAHETGCVGTSSSRTPAEDSNQAALQQQQQQQQQQRQQLDAPTLAQLLLVLNRWVAAGLAELGGTGDLCSSSWMQQYGEAVQSNLSVLTEQQLESIAYGLYRLRFAPSRVWVAAVVADLQRRLPATDTPAARALAYIQQLKCV